ncbi:non-ribosomal peptide synthetase [Streptomyces sp. NRRL B-1347]|uniref:amino acid adenylation domain-containing protein n=1 Tax=Streptomyces sp. NRRL B-1347 TaxID=1476877 RepID=UPI000690FC81
MEGAHAVNDVAGTSLTAYQRDIWVGARRAPESPQFNCVLWDRIEGRVDLGALLACAERALRGHEALRLRFDEHEGAPRQWVDPEPLRVRVRDFSDGPDATERCAAWRERSLARALPLTGGPLVEATVLVEGPEVVHLHVKAHHLVADGWAFDLLSRQILQDYRRRAHGDGRPAPAGTSSYLAWADEEARYRNGAEHARDEAFHRRALDGATPALFTRTPAAGGHRVRHAFVVEGALVERVKSAGLSPFAYVAAVLGSYLARVHRSEETILGIPFHNRPDAGQHGIVGQFANTLPLRIAVGGTRTVRELAAAVRETVDTLRPHQRLALGDVLRALPSAAGPRQLFDVTLSYLRYDRSEGLPDLAWRTSMLAVGHDTDALAVTVQAFDGVADMRVELDGAGDVFDADFPLAAAARQLKTLMENGLDALDRPASTVEMLTPADRADLTAVRGHGPKVPFADRATLHGLFEEQAARRPDQVAVTGHAGETLTYAELDARADRVARALRADGVGRDDRVAVVMPRCPQLFVALLGILKAGGAYVPVDPRHPADRVRFLLADSSAKVVVVEDEAPLTGVPDELPVRSVGDLLHRGDLLKDSGPLVERAGIPSPTATADDLAYVIYTSGSTGRPKGVLVEHRSVVNRLAWMQRTYPLGEGDVLLQKTPISFDVSVWELFWWAIEGASVALLPPGGEQDPREILRTIGRRGISKVHFVPSMLGPFLDLLEEEPKSRADVASLRHVFCSGEALPAARVDQFNRLFGPDPAVRLVNLYGPTEATIDVTYHDCPSDPARPVTRVPIGRPIDNIQLYVLDPAGLPQPVGVPGELCIGGVGVARGYLGRADLTAEKFIDDPFTPGGRLYRTGDLTRWLADGSVAYLGRIDAQVKIRGNRVEPGEAARALADVPGVRDAVVVDHTTPRRGTHLIGYYVAETAIPAQRLRDHLAQTLPAFMIPARFLRIDGIPLTPNGKADRRALPLPEAEADQAAGAQPLDATQAALAEIWARVLDVERVGIHDDYFALGGDSILMLKVRAEAEKRGLRFTLSELFQHPTVAQLAARTTAHHGDAEETDPEPEPFALLPEADRARLADEADAFPLTRLQLGLLYHSREHEGSARYKDVFQYTLDMPWHHDAFHRSFDRLTARHPVLRSSMDLAGFTEPLQIVHHRLPGALDVADLRALSRSEADAEVRRHVEERRHHPYPLDGTPLYLLRAHLRGTGVELVLSFHHALLDGASVANLLRELLQDYAHELGTGTAPVPASPPPSPAAYAYAERRALADDAARRHFRDTLAHAGPPRIDGLGPHLPHGEHSAVAHRADLPRALVRRLRAVAAEHTLPVKSLLFATHCLTLSALASSRDITTGLITHGRVERAHAERAVGLFLNTVPLRVDTARDSWLDVAREALRQERDSHPHRRYPLSAVEEHHGGPVVDSAFNYVHFHQLAGLAELPGIELRSLRTWEESNFRLLVNAVTEPDGNHTWLRVDADGSTFCAAQAALYARHYLEILTRLAEEPHARPDFTFLAAPVPSTAPKAHPSVVERFAEQVTRTPQATALVRGQDRWSYTDLNTAADHVARQLRTAGTPAGARVAIAMDRSPHTVAVLLGVLKAGAAVVPLDTNYPAPRLAAMLAEARPFRVIATARHAHLAGDVPLLPAEDLIRPRPDTAGRQQDEGPGARSQPEGTAPDSVGAGAARGRIDPGHTAYVLFTSGSTGRPKGVAMPHRSLAHLVAWQLAASSGATGGSTLQYAPLSFDVSFQEIFSTLCGGGTLHLVGEAERHDMPALLRLIDQEGIQRVFLPYVALQHMAETSDALGLVPRGLRVLISSGEQLRVTPEIRRLCAALPGVILENQYGPTETHVATAHTMAGDPAAFPALPPIGVPVEGAEAHVLDEELRPLPAGARGEIHLGGACLADGYEGQPELTDERFVPSPFTPSGRLYRTGDLGLVLPDGGIVCVGRADSQVKVRGFRVEPAEVELALHELTAYRGHLREAAVVARQREGGDCFLAAFLTGDADRVDLDALRGELRGVLPDFMVPAHLEWIPRLPLTPSGKRDDAALRAMPLARRAVTRAHAPDALEEELTRLLADLLGLPDVAPYDSLFELGGTSLTAMRLAVRIEQRYQLVIPLAALVAEPTAAALATRLRSGRKATAFDPLVPIRTGGSRPPLFLVHPMGGNVLCYLPFARHLPDDQPLYALQAAGTHQGTAPLDSVEEMARSYLAALRTVQPQGPYQLGGWSFGGFVAYETARQLRAAGEEVSHLVLLDTTALRPGPRPRHDDEALLHWFFWELLWLDRGGDSPMPSFPGTLTSLTDKLAFVARAASDAGVLPAGSSTAAVHRLFDLYRANWRAALDYRPEDTRQDLTLIRASQPLPPVLAAMHRTARSRHQDRTNGWSDITSGLLRVIDVPGDHLTLMEEPNVHHTAKTVTDLLTSRSADATRAGER